MKDSGLSCQPSRTSIANAAGGRDSGSSLSPAIPVTDLSHSFHLAGRTGASGPKAVQGQFLPASHQATELLTPTLAHTPYTWHTLATVNGPIPHKQMVTPLHWLSLVTLTISILHCTVAYTVMKCTYVSYLYLYCYFNYFIHYISWVGSEAKNFIPGNNVCIILKYYHNEMETETEEGKAVSQNEGMLTTDDQSCLYIYPVKLIHCSSWVCYKIYLFRSNQFNNNSQCLAASSLSLLSLSLLLSLSVILSPYAFFITPGSNKAFYHCP